MVSVVVAPYAPSLLDWQRQVSTAFSSLGEQRQTLTADQSYYVSTSGSDANDGSQGAPFGTIQKAIDHARSSLDLGGHTVVINVADGTYTSPILINGPVLNGSAQPLQIIGNEATPANVILSMTNDTALQLRNGAYCLIAGVTTQTTTGGYGWIVDGHSTLDHRNCKFGNVFADMIIVLNHSTVNALGPLTVTGNANSFVHITIHSRVSFSSQSIAFNGNTFATYVWGLNDATLALDGTTITGAQPSGATAVHDHSFINTYSLVNAGGWGYLGKQAPIVQDGSDIAADGFVARTFYVRSDANGNGTDGLENTTSRAFKSIQSCLDFITAMPFNPANYTVLDGVHINIADGTYAETLTLRDAKYISARLTGNTTTPANVIINGPADGVLSIGVNTSWTVEGMQVNAAVGAALRCEQNAKIDFSKIDFGNCSEGHIKVLSGGVVRAMGNYSASHGAPYHIQTQGGGRINLSASGAATTVTLTGTPAFSSAFARSYSNGSIICDSTKVTFSGSATGKRYDLFTNGVVDTNGGATTYLPGSIAGTTATGGQYG